MRFKRGQITLFVILAILVVASVAAYFALRGTIFSEAIPPNVQVVEKSFLTCLEEDLLTGVDVLESQGGYIQIPDFEPGSDYMPFSSELDFLGNPIPYWYYVSGNGIKREQVPTKKLMERQLADFIEGEIRGCEFENYYAEGYSISKGEPSAEVIIKDNEVVVDLTMALDVSNEEGSAIVKRHKKTIKSNLGNLYDSALKVYNYEQENLFLERYGIDVLRLYAPVDGVEISCSPLFWNADNVFANLSEAIEINTMALKNSGDDDDYFVVDLPVSEEVRFFNSQNWARTYEVLPSEENLLLASPVGNQPGFGILGFCYVPYHFVYDLKYPVLVQVVEDDEIFQFPMAVVIQGNNARESLDTVAVEAESIDLCGEKNTPVTVNVLDSNSNPVGAEIFYECFGERCKIGSTSSGSLQEDFPQCVNGFVVAKADGFEESRTLFSSASGGSVSVFVDRLYPWEVKLNLDGVAHSGQALVSFVSEDSAKNVIYPDQKMIELSAGIYDVEVQVYREAALELGEIKQEQCVEIPVGIFSLTRKKCFDIEVPSQLVSNALAGGGKQEHFILDAELSGSRIIEVGVKSLPEPKTIEQLSDNYALFENEGVDVSFI